jgi:hypothetical protein
MMRFRSSLRGNACSNPLIGHAMPTCALSERKVYWHPWIQAMEGIAILVAFHSGNADD